MSVYSYFADKQAILLALAEDVFEQLAARASRDQPANPMDALIHGMREFAAFGMENPNEYRIIFMTEKPHAMDAETAMEHQKNNPALAGMRACVVGCIDAGSLKGDPHAITTFLWTTMHGAISAVINFPHYPFGGGKEYTDRAAALALEAVKAGTVEPLANGAMHC